MNRTELCENLEEYFEKSVGTGVLATSDAKGMIDIAVYARPYVFGDDTVAFVMADRLSHKNLQSNPHAAYLFTEYGGQFAGKRLLITKVREEDDNARIYELMKQRDGKNALIYKDVAKYLVFFKIDKVFPLVGSDRQCF